MRQVVLISGRLCTGKSGLAKGLADEFAYHIVKTGEILQRLSEAAGATTDRLSLQRLGDKKDAETNFRWVYEEMQKAAAKLPGQLPIVVDSVRHPQQIEHFRADRSLEIVHVHLYAKDDELEKRFREAHIDDSAAMPFSDADILKDELDVASFKTDADVRVFTNRSDARDTLVRVAAHVGLQSSPYFRAVDVLIGGQYGSEGKGHVAAYLACDYDVLVRVGGPNAGHTVSSASGIYTYHQLPSGAKDTDAQLLLGPGMTVHVDKLLKEIEECRVSPDRLFIDPQVMIIEEEDFAREREMVHRIASTGRGGGAAAARRILGRTPGAVRLARDVPELRPYVGEGPQFRGSTRRQLEKAYREGCSVLLEGTQGSGLSLYHGLFPYVTSRDTNVAGCLAEAGIPPSRVRRILMVVRSTPIRVGDPDKEPGCIAKAIDANAALSGSEQQQAAADSSGPLKHPTTFQAIAEEAGIDVDETLAAEITSTTKRKRKVGRFDFEQFRDACILNGPTDIVLTFADYISGENRKARRFEQLTSDTIKFVDELERISQASVSLINTRFLREGENIDLRTIIDRRNWVVKRARAETQRGLSADVETIRDQAMTKPRQS